MKKGIIEVGHVHRSRVKKESNWAKVFFEVAVFKLFKMCWYCIPRFGSKLKWAL